MTRTIDRIDVVLDEPATVDRDTAWADLRAIIYEAVGFDIERGNHFAVRTMPISGSAGTHAFIACPRTARTPEDMMRQGFMSIYGSLPSWASDLTKANAERGRRPIFAVPLSTAMRAL